MMRCRSLKALASSEFRAARASSGFAAKRRGTGPKAVSPSKRLQVRSHSAIETVTTASLNKGGVVRYVYLVQRPGCEFGYRDPI